MLRFYDTAAGAVVDFVPRDVGTVSMYVCGPTVYGPPHIGHGRSTLVYDVLRRYLEWRGFTVRHVSNITDIDDRIIARATAEGRPWQEIADECEAEYWQAMDALGIQRPHKIPHATEYVEGMIALISDLVARGSAYETADGVYLESSTVPSYGLLTHQSLDDLRAGARVDVVEDKRSHLDFALWKRAKPGEPSWPSPFGDGRPGWHTECVVMSLDLLGEGFDLHLGGLDLVFPHHENERAQAVADGKVFARRWAHNGMVVDEGGEKMSKSLGNITSLEELLARYEGRVLRALVLQTHYRAPMSVNAHLLDQAQGAINRLDNFARETRALPVVPPDEAVIARFKWRMDDDFDTPGALAVIFGAVRDARADPSRAPALAAAVRECCERALGLALRADDEPVEKDVAEMVLQRDAARTKGDFAAADSIRAGLQAMGYVVEDGPEGTIVRRER
jgi:cysteinyl-tRNA synthetase